MSKKMMKKTMTLFMAAAMFAPAPVFAAQDLQEGGMLIAENAEQTSVYTVKLTDPKGEFTTMATVDVTPDKDGNISAASYIGVLPAGYAFASEPKDLKADAFEELKAHETPEMKKFEYKVELRTLSEDEQKAIQVNAAKPVYAVYAYGRAVNLGSWDAIAKNGEVDAKTLNEAIAKQESQATYKTDQPLKEADLRPAAYFDGVKFVVIGSIANIKADANFHIMYRLYNPNSGEHFYTAAPAEKNALIDLGWKYEGEGWNAPVESDTPVYRLYNQNAGDHHYTTDENEKDALVDLGWKDEGIGWYSADKTGDALLRLYNPNAEGAGSHHYTTDENEKNTLVKIGWVDEGIGWYGLH